MNTNTLRTWLIGALLVPGAVLAAWDGPVLATEDERTALESQVKAAFLYKFSGYVEWPHTAFASPNASLVFGVIGDDVMADELQRLVSARGAGARPVTVVKLKPFAPLPDLHVLFIGRSEADRVGSLIRAVRSRPILVVTDSDGALTHDSMINFKVVDGHVRFEIGLGAAQRRGLTLSSRLLAVAQTVRTRTP